MDDLAASSLTEKDGAVSLSAASERVGRVSALAEAILRRQGVRRAVFILYRQGEV